MVERFIAPVLKTGDPSRGPGVRIPPPLQEKIQTPATLGFFDEGERVCAPRASERIPVSKKYAKRIGFSLDTDP